jgi:hypothetical protein
MEFNYKINDILAQEITNILDNFNEVLKDIVLKLQGKNITDQELNILKSNIKTIQNGTYLFYNSMKDLEEEKYNTSSISDKYKDFTQYLKIAMNLIDPPKENTTIVGYVDIHDLRQLSKLVK